MIEKFKEKFGNGQIQLEFGETAVVVIERRFRETDGVPVMKPTQEFSSAQIDDLIADNESQLEPFLQRRQDLADLKTKVLEKEAERDEMIANLSKPKKQK